MRKKFNLLVFVVGLLASAYGFAQKAVVNRPDPPDLVMNRDFLWWFPMGSRIPFSLAKGLYVDNRLRPLPTW